MAHVEKIKKSGVIGLVIHCERRKGCELSNKDIDKSRTYLNYNLAKDIQPLKPEVFLKQRINEVKHMNRSDIVFMADWIVTVPNDVHEDDIERFFDYTFEFLKEKYGEKNVVSAWVHNDETTSHIHFSFIPIITIEGIERLNCKRIITKSALKQFHPELGAYLEQRLGYMPSIQNDATINGNRTIKELKNQEDLSLKKSLVNVHEHLDASNHIVKLANEIDFEPSRLLEKTKSLKKCNKIIDELKYNNKQLQNDTKSLSNLVQVQKKEIDSYRQMPLSKQLKEKEQTIYNLYSSLETLENHVRDIEYDFSHLRKNYDHLEQKNDKLENELYYHRTFLNCLDLNQIFKSFKRLFNREDDSINIHSLKELCQKAHKKISHVFQTIKEKVYFLDNSKEMSEDIILKDSTHSYHDMEL